MVSSILEPTISYHRPTLPTTLPYALPSFSKNGHRRTISHLIVRKCCEVVYELLTNTPTDVAKVEYIFGHALAAGERTRLISEIYHAMQSDVEDKVERKTNVLGPLRTGCQTSVSERVSHSLQTWDSVELNLDQWLDASNVEAMLLQRGACNIDTQPSFGLNARGYIPEYFNLENFITTLSRNSICVGPGPVFLKQHVEAALKLATTCSF